MYIPDKYKNTNLLEVQDFIKSNSFGILTSLMKGRLWATHIPLELETKEDGTKVLVGHIAKANPQWKYFSDIKEVLCIFNGPHSYISSSWYKEEEVPTWNYIAVHIYGSLRVQKEKELISSLHKLVERHEENSKKPFSLKDVSQGTMRQIKGVVGFEITINEIKATYKLSQGRKEDHEVIISELNKSEDDGSKKIAGEMAKRSADK